MYIAIDGPAASGKGTIASAVAEHFNFFHIDTGIFYRLYPDIVDQLQKVPMKDRPTCMVSMMEKCDPDLLRNEEHARNAAKFAQNAEVRSVITSAVRLYAGSQVEKYGGIVADGRDIGTSIFPHADVKIYVTASLEKRAKRRFAELLRNAKHHSLAGTTADIQARDMHDTARSAAPLRQAEDADLLDTSEMTIEQAVQRAIALVEARINA